MSDMNFIDSLNDFGLTRQEGTIYSALLNHGEMTGYEVAKDTGISRSNVYAALTALVEKGAACLIEGESTKYRPVEITLFTSNRISDRYNQTGQKAQKSAGLMFRLYFLPISCQESPCKDQRQTADKHKNRQQNLIWNLNGVFHFYDVLDPFSFFEIMVRLFEMFGLFKC